MCCCVVLMLLAELDHPEHNSESNGERYTNNCNCVNNFGDKALDVANDSSSIPIESIFIDLPKIVKCENGTCNKGNNQYCENAGSV